MLDFSRSLECVAKSDLGMRRANNQDSFGVVLAADEASWRERGHLCIVADGMGAHAAGELASRIAVNQIPHLYQHHGDLPAPQALKRAVIEANAEIHKRGLANPDFHNMGTTASTLVLLPQGAWIAHVGDSRVYRVRGDQFEQLTFDHSLQWELGASGQLDQDSEFAKTIPKNVITRSLGPQPTVAVDLEGPFEILPGDAFLLCSDGLSGQVKDDEIGAILANLPPEEAVRVLVDLANLRGGPDNVTVVVARVVGDKVVSTGGERPRASDGGTRKKSKGNLAAWVVGAVCLFVALVLWIAGQPIAGVFFAVVGVGALIFGIGNLVRQRLSPAAQRTAAAPAGKAPYRRVTCRAGRELVSTLSAIVNELREAAEEAHWDVEWEPFDEFRESAMAAAKAQRYPDAVRGFSKAISFLMGELRNQQNRKASDSAVEL